MILLEKEVSILDGGQKRSFTLLRFFSSTHSHKEAEIGYSKEEKTLQARYKEYKKTGKLFHYEKDPSFARSVNQLFMNRQKECSIDEYIKTNELKES